MARQFLRLSWLPGIFATIVVGLGLAAGEVRPELGREVPLTYFAVIGGAIPVFVLAFIVRLRDEGERVTNRLEELDSTLRGIEREVEGMSTDPEAEIAEDVAALRDELREEREDWDAARVRAAGEYRGFLMGAMVTTFLLILLGEASALAAIASDHGAPFTFFVSTMSMFGVVLLLAIWEVLKLSMTLRT